MVDTQPNKAVSIIECDMKVIYLFIIIFFVCVCVCVWGGGVLLWIPVTYYKMKYPPCFCVL